jgi:hypothetical protein
MTLDDLAASAVYIVCAGAWILVPIVLWECVHGC